MTKKPDERFNGPGSPRQSRRNRQCDWCCDTIGKGDQYIHWFGLADGDPSKFDSHPECNEAYLRGRDTAKLTWDEYPLPPGGPLAHRRGHTFEESEACGFASAPCPMAPFGTNGAAS